MANFTILHLANISYNAKDYNNLIGEYITDIREAYYSR